MTDPIDATPTQQKRKPLANISMMFGDDELETTKREIIPIQKRELEYRKCSHCGMYSASEGVCPFCNRGAMK